MSVTLDDLPLILAGPILRRVEANAVSVWLALKEDLPVTLRVFDPDGNVAMASTPSRPFRIGDHLWLVVVTARPTGDPLSPGVLYEYDVQVGDRGRLATEGVLSSATYTVDLAYPGHSYPAFRLPAADAAGLRLAHASCRKPHGSWPDALAHLDRVLEGGPDDETRPQQLFLTGDQIYADDVADALLHLIRDRATALLGWTETAPVTLDPASLRPGARGKMTRELCRLTANSGARKSHLLFFEEFALMYLFAWSDVLWPQSLPKAEAVYQGGEAPSTFYEECTALRAFKDTLPKVRRLLANIPSYMIFDDHEITDDWYLDAEWCRALLDAPMGMRTIQNGMLAYALFQDWGNKPADYESWDGQGLLSAARAWIDARGAVSADADLASRLGVPHTSGRAEMLSGLDSEGMLPKPPHAMHWHYHLDYPGHRIVVLDTRTMRGFRDGEEGAQLLHPSAYAGERRQLPDVSGERLTILVSPAPVLNFQMIEDGQNLIRSLAGPYLFDFEPWSGSESGFEQFLREAAARYGSPRHPIVILSGDVHYSYTMDMHYWSHSGVGAHFIQCTSSAAKNATVGGGGFLMRAWFTESVDDFLRAGWQNPGASIRHVGYRVNGHDKRKVLVQGSPALLKCEVARRGGNRFLAEREPEWKYRVRLLGADVELPEGITYAKNSHAVAGAKGSLANAAALVSFSNGTAGRVYHTVLGLTPEDAPILHWSVAAALEREPDVAPAGSDFMAAAIG